MFKESKEMCKIGAKSENMDFQYQDLRLRGLDVLDICLSPHDESVGEKMVQIVPGKLEISKAGFST